MWAVFSGYIQWVCLSLNTINYVRDYLKSNCALQLKTIQVRIFLFWIYLQIDALSGCRMNLEFLILHSAFIFHSTTSTYINLRTKN